MMKRTDMERRLRDTIQSPKYVGCEINGDIRIALAYTIMCAGGGYLYGTMDNMDCFVRFFLNKGIHIFGIIDRTGVSIGETFMGFPVLGEDDFDGERNKEAVIFSFYVPSEGERNNFLEQVGSNTKVFYFNGIMRQIITMNSGEACDRNRIVYYLEHQDEIIWLLDYLSDEKSFSVLNEYIRTYSERDVYRLEEVPSEYKYFFGQNREPIYKHLDNEVWMNFGASTGDDIFSFFSNNLKAQQIYAIEADEIRYLSLSENIRMLPRSKADIVHTMNLFVTKDMDLEKLFSSKKITLINADIEGAELEMLYLLSNIIIRDHPVLAICMYHRKEDLVEIPKYIIHLYDGYRFFLRKYAFCWCNVNRNQELVLYAVPEDRRV